MLFFVVISLHTLYNLIINVLSSLLNTELKNGLINCKDLENNMFFQFSKKIRLQTLESRACLGKKKI